MVRFVLYGGSPIAPHHFFRRGSCPPSTFFFYYSRKVLLPCHRDILQAGYRGNSRTTVPDLSSLSDLLDLPFSLPVHYISTNIDFEFERTSKWDKCLSITHEVRCRQPQRR